MALIRAQVHLLLLALSVPTFAQVLPPQPLPLAAAPTPVVTPILPPLTPSAPPPAIPTPPPAVPAPDVSSPVAPALPGVLGAARVTEDQSDFKSDTEDEELTRLLSQDFASKDLLGSDRVSVPEREESKIPEMEASRVREAALDDKLGVELRSIVEQIQVMDEIKDRYSNLNVAGHAERGGRCTERWRRGLTSLRV